MNRDLQVIRDFFNTQKRAQRLAQIQTTGIIDRLAFCIVVLAGDFFDTCINPQSMMRWIVQRMYPKG